MAVSVSPRFPQLSARIKPGNLNHHLWNNNGTWFIHYVVHPTRFTKERVRRSLGTKSLDEARSRRDALLARLAAVPGQLASV